MRLRAAGPCACLIVLLAVLTPAPSIAHADATFSDPSVFGPGNWPPGTWRPFSDSSPWNRPLPANPRIDPNSNAIVQRFASLGPPAPTRIGTADTSADYKKPYYIGHDSDPLYRVQGGSDVAPYNVNGQYVHMPSGARPAAGSDHHLAVIYGGYEWGFWNASVDSSAHVIKASTGRKLPIAGDGLRSSCTAGRFSCLDGMIRAQEIGPSTLIKGGTGKIEHTLFVAVNSVDNDSTVFPAYPVNGSANVSQSGLTFGTRFQLNLTTEQIDAMPVPNWRKRIFKTMARYGMIVGDITGSSWKLGSESGTTYTSFGRPDPWVRMAQTWELPRYYESSIGRYLYLMNLDGPDWSRDLRVIAPCVSIGNC